MTSKERVLAAFGHREPDRVPLWYGASVELTRKLMKATGTCDSCGEGVSELLSVGTVVDFAFRPEDGKRQGHQVVAPQLRPAFFAYRGEFGQKPVA